MAMKLTSLQIEVLKLMAVEPITYSQAAKVGGNGKTLFSLVIKGVATKRTAAGYPGNTWSITPAGRAVLTGDTTHG